MARKAATSMEKDIVFEWLVKALEQDLSRYPSDYLLNKSDDAQMTGAGPSPVNRAATISEVRRWRSVLQSARRILSESAAAHQTKDAEKG